MSRGRRRKKEDEAIALAQPLWFKTVQRIINQSRPARLSIAIYIAAAATFSVSPAVDKFYLDNLLSLEMPILPAIVASAVGVLVFVAGWWLIVGVVGETPQARRAILWYFGFGLLVTVGTIAWLALWISGNASLPVQPAG